ncbi:hypothetical protein HUB97_07625 [Halorubraceae archaeon YAN]|nr:hypothetical protein [Halorubraceae archaeon YAN]
MTTPLPLRENIPQELIDREQWVCWDEQTRDRDSKQTKVPINPSSGSYASTTDRSTWCSLDTALSYVSDGNATGIGFVFSDKDPIVGVDLDKCRDPDTGVTENWAQEIIEQLDSYTEISPSKTGYHVLVTGDLPSGGNRRGGIELYENARFFTVTGERVRGRPQQLQERSAALASVHARYINPVQEKTGGNKTKTEGNAAGDRGLQLGEGTDRDVDSRSQTSDRGLGSGSESSLDDAELVSRAQGAANGDKFDRLWRGDIQGYDSHSEADMALCMILAFWSNGDRVQMDRLFRHSDLFREKWDVSHFSDGSTYGEKTIERAIDMTSEFYTPARSSIRSDWGDSGSSSGNESTSDGNFADSDGDVGEVREGVSVYLNRINELTDRIQSLVEENASLQEELSIERDRRLEVEAELEARSERPSRKWYLRWLSR